MEAVKRADSRDDTLLRLMTEYEIPIRRMCCVYLRDEALAADAVQETFLKAYLALQHFRAQASEKTWLTRIAINVCKDMRRSGWLRFVDRRVTLDKLPEPVSDAPYALMELTLDIMRLPQKHLDVVLLHDYQGLTVREAAEVLGIPHQTVISRLNTAHKKLRMAFSESEHSPTSQRMTRKKGGAPE
ncbi:MAG: RNA polymerase sigma factor [Clostridia bacterium]|nr:RNA polymerase sigma factor [Clostridia bacterium]